jgi:nucleotide-binding universal stress UspA family protein
MNQVKKILAPTDLSELSRAGVRYTLEHAASTGTEVIVYNVVGYQEVRPYYGFDVGYAPEETLAVEELVEEHRRHLAEFLRKNFFELIGKAKIRQEVDVGTPYLKIVEKAAAENVDMIIISTHGRTGFIHALIGSVAEKVVRLATCPVFTVRPKKEESRTQAAA